ncbi:MAG: hypothetical protein AMXMBFR12_06700 [Candidatus Babeliales bacterium]
MPNPPIVKLHKPGFLLIEIMCSILLFAIAASIMAFYGAYVQKEQKKAQNRMGTMLEANRAIDQLKEGNKPIAEGAYQIHVFQNSLDIEWDDGARMPVWPACVEVYWHDEHHITLQTILEKKVV